jgi:hypothetical protein
MRVKSFPLIACRCQHLPGANCKRAMRCCKCGRPLPPFCKGWVCDPCRTERDTDRPDAVAQIGGEQ